MFPVFGINGQEDDLSNSTGEQSPSGVRFPIAEQPLPRVHDGSEQAAIEKNVRTVLEAINPRLLQAFDERDRKQEELRQWLAHRDSLGLRIEQLERRRAQRNNAGDYQMEALLLCQLQPLRSQLDQVREEVGAAQEELDAAEAAVRAVLGRTEGKA